MADIAQTVSQITAENAALRAEIASLRRDHDGISLDIKEIAQEVKGIRYDIAQAHGAWRLLVFFSALSGAVGALIAKFFTIKFG